jgi:hypothetical protein
MLHLYDIAPTVLYKTAFLTLKNSLVTTPLVTWNFNNFTIFYI